MEASSIDIDYLEERFPYHMEMINSFEFEGDIFTLYYEKGGKSEFSLCKSRVLKKDLEERFIGQEGKIVYVFQNREETMDIAVELVNLTGCCLGVRKLLISL